MAPEPMRTAKELAELTRISYRTILNAVNKGELESVRFSGSQRGTIYIADSAYERWIAKNRTQTVIKGRLGASQSVKELALK